jgi:hypothetical protein
MSIPIFIISTFDVRIIFFVVKQIFPKRIWISSGFLRVDIARPSTFLVENSVGLGRSTIRIDLNFPIRFVLAIMLLTNLNSILLTYIKCWNITSLALDSDFFTPGYGKQRCQLRIRENVDKLWRVENSVGEVTFSPAQYFNMSTYSTGKIYLWRSVILIDLRRSVVRDWQCNWLHLCNMSNSCGQTSTCPC